MHTIVAFALSSNKICWTFCWEITDIFFLQDWVLKKQREVLCPVSLDVTLPQEVKQHLLYNKGSMNMFYVGGWMKFKLYALFFKLWLKVFM